MVRPNLYIGSKVRVWSEKGGWDDEPVKVMETFVAILFERNRNTISEDGYGDQFGFMKLNPEGTASNLGWWVDGEECTVIDNDLAANQDFIYANRGLFERHPDADDDEEDEEEVAHERDEEDELFQRLKAFVYNVERSEMVTVAKKLGIPHEGVDHRALGIALMVRLNQTQINALMDGEDFEDGEDDTL